MDKNYFIKYIFTEIFSEAFQTQCRKCTEKQKHMLEVTIDWYTKNEPEQWKQFVEKSLEDIKKKARENNS